MCLDRYQFEGMRVFRQNSELGQGSVIRSIARKCSDRVCVMALDYFDCKAHLELYYVGS